VKPHALFRTLLLAVVALAAVVAGSGSASSADNFAISAFLGSSTLSRGMTLSGTVVWTAAVNTTPTRVEFLIDGKLRWTEHSAPYQFNGDTTGRLDTTSLADGKHLLNVRAYRSDGRATTTKAKVIVANRKKQPPPQPGFTVSSSIAYGATLTGSLTWTASPNGATVSQVDFLIDGAVQWTEHASPYVFNGDGHQLDTTGLSNGPHTLGVKAYATDGRTATASGSVTISNTTFSPYVVSPYVVSSSVANGATPSGSIVWSASSSGDTTSKVDFIVDGTIKSTDASAPYQYNGDGGQLDTTTLANGSHTLAVTASSTSGRKATTSSSVTVSNSTATPPTLSGSIPAPAGPATVVGQVLTAATGTWNGTQPIAYAYQWQRCSSTCSDVSGATNATYMLASADVGSTLRFRDTATNTAGSAASTSAATATVRAPPSGTGWSSFVGVDAYRTTDLAQIAASGVKRVRIDSPSASTFAAAASSGIDVLPIADYEPWPDLNGGKGDKYPPLPANYKTWADRMIALWQSLPKPPAAIEVWNEPWLTAFWQPTPDPVAYYNLVKVFATEAWKVWPSVKILVSADTVGSTNTTGTNLWRQYLLAADKDGFLNDPRIQPTTHDYVEGRTPTAVTSKPCWWDLDRFKCAYNDFKAHGHPDPKVWVTEYGWDSGVVGEQNQASYVTQALSIFRDSGMVAATYSFFYKTDNSEAFNWLHPDNSPKPVVGAVKALSTG
jgi:hypothetical protein